MEKENVVKYIIFSIYSKDGNAVLPLVLAQNKKKKTKIFVDETEFSLSLQYAMKDSPKLINYLDKERKASTKSSKSVIVKMPIDVAGDEETPDWKETCFIYLKFDKGIATIKKYTTETELIKRKKRSIYVCDNDILVTSYGHDNFYAGIKEAIRVN